MPPDPPQPAPWLAIGDTPAGLQALAAALRASGGAAVDTGSCLTLVQKVGELAPRQVVCVLSLGIDGLLEALAAFGGEPPCPVTVHSPHADPDAVRALAQAGVTAWLPGLAPEVVAPCLAWAEAAFARDAALRASSREARAQLDERKWVDRAKGLLMEARSIAEDDAFKLLRNAAMHANLRLVDVARSVVDASRWAEAVNRAGQLRMLSQRLVALAAQRLARIDAARARTRQEQAAQRLQDNLVHLSALPLAGDAASALDTVRAAWLDLRAALERRLSSESLADADTRAEALLAGAHRLTELLEASAARPTLAIVNRCGSQRMRVQRITKQALLSRLQAGPAAEGSAAIDEFERVLAEIGSAPLSSPEIRAALDAARDGWLTLLRGLRAGDPAQLVHSSEALLGHLDTLTESCEHSLQVLMS